MALSIPESWMPEATMKRIHVHWTGGNYKPGDAAMKDYHILIDGEAKLLRTNTPISGNDPARRKPGMPRASHTRRANSHAIGVAMCGMFGAKPRPFDPGRYPLTEAQWFAMIQAVTILALHYRIPVTDKTILTHAEVQPNLGIAQDGKWDITHLPFDPDTQGAQAVGEKMRSEIKARRGFLLFVQHVRTTTGEIARVWQSTLRIN